MKQLFLIENVYNSIYYIFELTNFELIRYTLHNLCSFNLEFILIKTMNFSILFDKYNMTLLNLLKK